MKPNEQPIVGQPIYRIHDLEIYTDWVVHEELSTAPAKWPDWAPYWNNGTPVGVKLKIWTVQQGSGYVTYKIYEHDTSEYFLCQHEVEAELQKQLKALIKRRKAKIESLTKQIQEYEARLI